MNAEAVLKALEHDLIRDEFRPTGLLLPEVQAPNSDRRADAIWMTARTARITGYEIKVSRADLINELRDPTKCEPWLKYCDQWWLVVSDETILIGLMHEIPDDWGVCTPPTAANRRQMKVLKQAPMLTPADKAPVLGKLISHQSYKALDLQREAEQAKRAEQNMRTQLDNRDTNYLEHLQRQANPYEQKFAEVAAAYEKLEGREGNTFSYRINMMPAETIAQAILNGEQAKSLAEGVERAAKAKARDIDDALKSLGESYEMRRVLQLLKPTIDEVAA